MDALGLGFHDYNVSNRVGGLRWENFFYGAPLDASAALALSDMAGLASDRLSGNAKRHNEATLCGMPASRVFAAFTSLGLLGTMGQAGLLHVLGNVLPEVDSEQHVFGGDEKPTPVGTTEIAVSAEVRRRDQAQPRAICSVDL